eukprot:1157448-Rhodomonas_salina.1
MEDWRVQDALERFGGLFGGQSVVEHESRVFELLAYEDAEPNRAFEVDGSEVSVGCCRNWGRDQHL